MEEQMDNAELTIDQFAEQLMLSRTIFYRKLKSIVGLTPVDFIREIRIKRAVQLIDSDEYNFSQVAYMNGVQRSEVFQQMLQESDRNYAIRIQREEKVKNSSFSTG